MHIYFDFTLTQMCINHRILSTFQVPRRRKNTGIFKTCVNLNLHYYVRKASQWKHHTNFV